MIRGVIQSFLALSLVNGCSKECPDFARPVLLDLKLSDLELPVKKPAAPTKDAGTDAAQAEFLDEPSLPVLDCIMGPPPREYLLGNSTKPGAIEVSYEIDLDHDGRNDRFVTAENYCNVSSRCVYAIYALRGKCGLFVGVAFGYPGGFTRLPLTDYSFHEFETVLSCHRTIPGGDDEVRYRFNGRVYVGSEHKTCRDADYPFGDIRTCSPWQDLGGVPMQPDWFPGLCEWWPPELDPFLDADGGAPP